jgi:hypothetical protein
VLVAASLARWERLSVLARGEQQCGVSRRPPERSSHHGHRIDEPRSPRYLRTPVASPSVSLRSPSGCLRLIDAGEDTRVEGPEIEAEHLDDLGQITARIDAERPEHETKSRSTRMKPGLGASWAQVVGIRRGMDDDSRPHAVRSRQQCFLAVSGPSRGVQLTRCVSLKPGLSTRHRFERNQSTAARRR